MKKLGFVFTLVFAASFAMAQQNSFVGQNGVGNGATVTQAGAAGNNSWVNMTGDNGTATVNQLNSGFAGDNHNAKIDMQGVSGGTGNTASIDQQLQGGGDAIITQIGDKNRANILENGNFYINPADPGYDAYAYQEGMSNQIDMTIFGTNSSAWAYQKGDNNKIAQSLGQAVGQKVELSSVFASQVGSYNTALQYTEGVGFAGAVKAIDEVEHIEQNGNGNWGQQAQYAFSPWIAQDNYEELIQNGDGNASLQNQAGQNLKSYVTQNGNDNSTTVQIGYTNTIHVTQN